MNALTNPTTTSDNPWATAGAGAGSTTFMKFKGASGDYLAGADEEEIALGTQMAADVVNSRWVWSFWWEGEVLEKIECNVAEKPTAWEHEPNYLPESYDADMTLEEIRKAQADKSTNFMDGWGCQAVLGLREIGGEGTEYTFNMNAGVSLTAFRALLQSFGRQFKFKNGLIPVIELDVSSFKSKTKGVGKRYSPVLKIVDWKSEEDLQSASGENPDDYDDDSISGTTTKALENKRDVVDAAAEEGADTTTTTRTGRRGARGANYE